MQTLTGEGALIRAAVVDDEPFSRKRIRDLLLHESDITVVDEYPGGAHVADELSESRPDLIFMDVEMPQLSGFDIVGELATHGDYEPEIIFVTAFADYAVRAFDTRATDYLLKPFDRERFARALDRVRRRRYARASAAQEESAAEETLKHIDRLAVRSGKRSIVLRMQDVDYISAEGNYVRLHCGRESHLHRVTIAEFEQSVDPASFIRIHRSTIVNVDRIAALHSAFHRDLIVVLRDGKQLRLSATYRARLERAIIGV
ncbi:MAG: response regulator transcription factor [Acidobacteria bacterium]|nr:response regulator transcription factor [Acidobacteriota bacterium]MBV9479104.1 response regulator transcription factor [Acidobacteriota bacterium]